MNRKIDYNKLINADDLVEDLKDKSESFRKKWEEIELKKVTNFTKMKSSK